jgi:hypothetical protein
LPFWEAHGKQILAASTFSRVLRRVAALPFLRTFPLVERLLSAMSWEGALRGCWQPRRAIPLPGLLRRNDRNIGHKGLLRPNYRSKLAFLAAFCHIG